MTKVISAKHIHLTFIGMIALVIVTGCGGGGTSLRDRGMIEELDPFSLGDEFAGTANEIERAPGTTVPDENGPRKPAGGQSEVRQTPPAGHAERIRPYVIETTETDYVYRVQIGVFSEQEEKHADLLAEKARNIVDIPVNVEYDTPFYRVRAGNFSTKEDAERYVTIFRQNDFTDARWIRTLRENR